MFKINKRKMNKKGVISLLQGIFMGLATIMIIFLMVSMIVGETKIQQVETRAEIVSELTAAGENNTSHDALTYFDKVTESGDKLINKTPTLARVGGFALVMMVLLAGFGFLFARKSGYM